MSVHIGIASGQVVASHMGSENHIAYTVILEEHGLGKGDTAKAKMLIEKIDLKSPFRPVRQAFAIPLAKTRGWSYINGRAKTMARFTFWEGQLHDDALHRSQSPGSSAADDASGPGLPSQLS